MSYTIAQVRTAVLAILDDVSSARFTSAQIDQATRQALIEYDTYRPIRATYMHESDGETIQVLPTDFVATMVVKVRHYDDDDPDASPLVNFLARKIDEQWVLETPDETIAAAEVLEITYAKENTVDGLDSAAGTSIDNDNLLCMGAAGYAAQSRATSRAESINMQADVMIQLLTISSRLLAAFKSGLKDRQAEPFHITWEMPNVTEY